MTPEYVIGLGQETLALVLTVGRPLPTAAPLVGRSVSIFQAVTQVHEMTLTFIPKIIAVGATVILTLPWMLQQMVDFTTRLLASIPTVIG